MFCGWQAAGTSSEVMHSTFKRVAQDPEKMLLGGRPGRPIVGPERDYRITKLSLSLCAGYPRFAFNIPLMDLSPFPFHTSLLRSARSERPKSLYQAPDWRDRCSFKSSIVHPFHTLELSPATMDVGRIQSRRFPGLSSAVAWAML